MKISCFKAYDVRGIVPDELNSDVAKRIALGLIDLLSPKEVVIGQDVRSHSSMLYEALKETFLTKGVKVVNLGLCGTEEVYFKVGAGSADIGLMITASHNPAEYNGIKFVKKGAKPLSSEEMEQVKAFAESVEENFNKPSAIPTNAATHDAFDKSSYIDYVLDQVDTSCLSKLKIVANSGNGCAGPVIDLLSERLDCELISVQGTPDGNFPNGIPNPLDPEKRSDTIKAVEENKANFGVAFDGDFDRCFFFDEQARFIEGYYIVGLLAKAMLAHQQDAAIVYDNRMTWATEQAVEEAKGRPVICRTGHAFIKAKMRAEKAVYGGEMSAHHYFGNFFYCDTGILPFLLVAEHVAKSGKTLGALVDEAIRAFPCSGEINFKISQKDEAIKEVIKQFGDKSLPAEQVDGTTLEFENWRFNIRKSNTEPLLRLNVETRADQNLLQEKTDEITAVLNRFVD